MNKRPKVSVLIPVYNVENYICDCMDSVVNQTFKDIEIICVNDCSTDSSMQILQQYAENDDRVVLIDKKQNEGLLMARKSGVEAATGEYILFVDSDDYIDLNLCQFVNDITEKEDADIIHFSSGVDAEDSDKNFEGVVNALKPLEKTLIGDEILDNAYIKMTYATQVWGKIYKTDLCKKVYAVLPDEHCYVGEDVFTTFFLSHFAKKYVGVKTPQYYFYRFGFGISGQSMISVKKFEMFAKMSNWIKYTQEYLDTNNANEIQQKACNAMKDRLFADGCEIYRVRVRDEDKGAAEELIYKYWKDIPLNDAAWIKHIGKTKDYIENQYKISEYIKPADVFTEKPADVSAVIYVYNNAEILESVINKFTSQSLKNAEYIVVNDGSEDNSLEIIEKLASEDNRITVISQKHNGISAAYNKAINIARGKYIYFTDENCLLKDNFMEEAFNKAESNSLEVLCFEENGDNKIISGDNLLMFYVHNELSPYVIGSKLFLKEFIQKNKIAFDERISRSNQIFVPLLTVNAKRTLVENNCYIAFNNSKESKKNNGYTADDFAEYFMIYTILSSKSIVSDYSETAKKAISEISRDIYYISNDIYMNLSNEQAKKVNEILPIEFKPLFFNTRELRNIKTSATYRVGDKLTNLPRKILNKSK